MNLKFLFSNSDRNNEIFKIRKRTLNLEKI